MSPKAPKEAPKEEEEPEVTCPVCGNPVSLDDPFCPHCGAEFEEEEVEEIAIEEGAEEVPEAPVEEEIEIEIEEEFEVEPAEEVEGEEEVSETPAARAKPTIAAPATAILDMRVIGIALLILGIIGAQIAFFRDFYWSWVPAITDNIGMYALIGLAIVVIGFLGFTMIKKATLEKGKQYNPMLPTILLSIFIFGIFAVIFLLAGGAISDAMIDNQAIVAVMFIVFLVVGIMLYWMGLKKASASAA